jgi:hypothetical protein
VIEDGSIRGSYQVTVRGSGSKWAFEGNSDDLPKTTDPRFLLEVAKCEIDFVREVAF